MFSYDQLCSFTVKQLVVPTGISKMRKCGMRNAESKMRNAKCGMYVRNGV